jgi:hypothetical protein
MSNIDISKFCEVDDGGGRYGMNTPWRDGEYIYATDGRRIARILDDGRELPKCEGKRVNAKQLFLDMPFPESGWMPLPALPKCECKVGKTTERCESCNGLGTAECNMGHEHDCHECEGKGKVEMELECECKDIIGGWKFQRRVIAPFLEIEGIELAVVPSDKTKSGNLFFRKGEFAGIAMGLTE